jgi:hypothetical protein
MIKILCITPIKHLDGIFERLSKLGDIEYKPDFTKKDLKFYLNQWMPC